MNFAHHDAMPIRIAYPVFDMPFEATLLILSGGESRRMGSPKHRLCIGGVPIVERLRAELAPLFLETFLVGRGMPAPLAGVRYVEDIHRVRSPLAGIHSGLCSARTDLCFVVACDMPYVRPELVRLVLRRASGADVAVPLVGGYFEPLCAAYRRSALPIIEQAICDRQLKVSALYRELRTNIVSEDEVRSVDPHLVSFRNLNTPRDVAAHGTAEPELTIRS
jgi:molybdopterin-guanine dinucleotide biosynthesis protein A